MNNLKIMQLFTKSLVFGSVKHRSQRRKNDGDIPYINHPIEVADILAKNGVNDINILCAAILHDTVEDTETSPEEIQNQFNKEIKNIVMECTDDKKLGKVERKIKQIQHAKQISQKAKLVKIADKISNNQGMLHHPPSSWSKERILGYMIWSQICVDRLKGGNKDLDSMADKVFADAQLAKYSAEQKQVLLQQYYQGLEKVND